MSTTKSTKTTKKTNKPKLVIEEEAPKKMYTSISLFSGLGGDSLGMTQAGCKVIAYNEDRKSVV